MRKKIISTLMLVCALVCTMSTTAFAATSLDSLSGALDGDDAKLCSYLIDNFESNKSWLGGYLTTDVSKADNTYGSITLDNTTYYIVKGKTYGNFESRLSQAYKASIATTSTVEITDNLNVGADVNAANTILSGIVPAINILLGIMVVLITIGMAVFTAFDVCYITMPVVRSKLDEVKEVGQGPMVKKTANGGTKLRFVTDEAVYAATTCTFENGKNPLTAYLSKRVVAYIAVSIILFILLTGNINIITNIALKMIQGLMEVLSSFG